MKGLYNNQGRKSGGDRKFRIIVPMEKEDPTAPKVGYFCANEKHADCKKVRTEKDCDCNCHKAFIAPGEIKYKQKRRKYASYQNHLNRKRVIII